MTTCRTHLYADDMAVSVSGVSTNDLESKLNNKLRDVKAWMHRNQLTVNDRKTKYMTFGTQQTLSKVGDMNIGDDGINIEKVDTYKYLGIMMDKKLTFSDHVCYIRRKCVSRIRMLSKLRPIVGKDTCLSLYKSLITH